MVREMDFVDECYADKDLSLLKKLTLVIPTYNRNYYLSRCLWYHAHFPFGQIIVADSSPEEKKVVNRETVAKVREMFGTDILYLEYEPETEKYGGDIYRKWADAVMHVRTEYSQICTDKEYYIPTTQCKCIEFLEANSDYDVADGKIVYISRKTRDDYTLSNALPERREWSIDYPGIEQRLIAFLSSNDETHNLLSIRRANMHKKIYNTLHEGGVNDLRFGEFGFEILSTIQSKSKYFPEYPYSCRDICSSGTGSYSQYLKNSSAARYPTFEEYKEDGVYEKKLEDLIETLAREISAKNIDTPYDDAKKISEITIITLAKMRGAEKTGVNKMLTSIISSPIGILWNFIPINIKTHILRNLGLFNTTISEIINPGEELETCRKHITETETYRDSDCSLSLNRS